MHVAYNNTRFSVGRLQKNFQEATFTKAEMLEFLNGITAQNVKVALAVLPETNIITVVMLGMSNASTFQAGSEALYSPIPCPPNCRTVPGKPKIIISQI